MKSPKLSFKNTGVKIAVGGCIAMLGALATYLEVNIAEIDFGAYTGIVVAFNSILVNAIRTFVKEYK